MKIPSSLRITLGIASAANASASSASVATVAFAFTGGSPQRANRRWRARARSSPLMLVQAFRIELAAPGAAQRDRARCRVECRSGGRRVRYGDCPHRSPACGRRRRSTRRGSRSVLRRVPSSSRSTSCVCCPNCGAIPGATRSAALNESGEPAVRNSPAPGWLSRLNIGFHSEQRLSSASICRKVR